MRVEAHIVIVTVVILIIILGVDDPLVLLLTMSLVYFIGLILKCVSKQNAITVLQRSFPS